MTKETLRQERYDNGQLKYKENYKDGEREGLWQEWYDNGKLICKGNYKDGKLK